MENLKKPKELPFELSHFHAEELEERLENCWKGQKKETVKIPVNECDYIEKDIVVDC